MYFYCSMIRHLSTPNTIPSEFPLSHFMFIVPISSTSETVPSSPGIRFEYGSSISIKRTLVPGLYCFFNLVSDSFVILFMKLPPSFLFFQMKNHLTTLTSEAFCQLYIHRL